MLSDKDRRGIWLITGVAAVVVAMLGARMALEAAPTPDEDGCIGTPDRNTVIVLDHTDQQTQQTRAEIMARALTHIEDNVQINERVTVFSVTALSRNDLRPLISRCKPRTEGNRAIEDTRRVKREFADKFETPLKAALATDIAQSPQSPLAQAITDISLSKYLSGRQNALLVFSDMLENTERFSLYKCRSSEGVIHAYRSANAGRMERPHFTNTKVSLNIVPRPETSPATLKCRDVFWPWFFGDNEGPNAQVLAPMYLPG